MKEKLECHVKEDGTVWLTFNSRSGRSASINLEALANNVHGELTERAIKDWCDDRLLEHRRGEVAI